MALYKLSDEGEAVRTDMDGHSEWIRSVSMDELTLARHEVIQVKGTIVAVDTSKHMCHRGQVLNVVITRLRTSTEEYSPPWETWVEGEDEPRYRSGSREQAQQAHCAVVNRKIKDHGGRVLIR